MRLNAQLTIDTTDPTKLMPSYVLPADSEDFSRIWWRIGDAAEAWGCDVSTAKRLIDKHARQVGRTVVWIVTPRGASARVVIPKDTPRPQVKAGNPRFGPGFRPRRAGQADPDGV